MQKEVVDLTGFSPDKVKRLAELKVIEFDGKHYNEGTVKQYMNYELKILNDCCDLNEFITIVGIPKYTGLHNIELHFPDEFPLLNIIKLTSLLMGNTFILLKIQLSILRLLWIEKGQYSKPIFLQITLIENMD